MQCCAALRCASIQFSLVPNVWSAAACTVATSHRIASHRIASHRIASQAVEVWQLSTAVPSKLGLVGSVTVDDVRWAFRLLFFRHNYAKEKRDRLLVRTVR